MGVTERRNVFIVGAGASSEFGLPTGAGLLDAIRNSATFSYDSRERLMSGDDFLKEVFIEAERTKTGKSGVDNQAYIEASNKIAQNAPLAPSIDNFLHTRRGEPFLVEVGKLLIAYEILKAERASRLFVDPHSPPLRLDYSARHSKDDLAPGKSWLAQLFKLLVSQRGYPDFKSAIS